MTVRTLRMFGTGAGVVAIVLAGVIHAPAVLAFPHRATIGEITVHSVDPIGPEMAGILDCAAQQVAASAIAAPLGKRSIYLTDGGWRWTLLTLPRSQGAYALTRPLSSNIVVNRASIAGDAVSTGATVGRRTLSGTIAHETTHLLIRRRYGLASIGFPEWKVEGYCDHVAGESSLSDAEAAMVRGAGKRSGALVYYDARRRVAGTLAGGATVDGLFRE